MESMLVSCHSFIRVAKLAEPRMDKGGSLVTLSLYGAEKVVDHSCHSSETLRAAAMILAAVGVTNSSSASW